MSENRPRALRKPAGGEQASRSLSFDENRLLLPLFGEHDQHLALIEDRLGVDIASRGNHAVISGGKPACDMAAAALTALYKRLKGGANVAIGDVEGAVKMALAGNGEQPRQITTRKGAVTSRSPKQQLYIEALSASSLIFATGPAGTGKTYLAVAAAAAALAQGRIDRIILSRPAVEAGERLGFLPGDMRDKVDPYLRPLYDALYDMLPGDQVARGLENGTIEIAPLAFMRGRTLSNAFIILDEAQNCTSMQMKMFLTRLGENSRMAVTGDPTQTDLPRGVECGLVEAVGLLDKVRDVAHIAFTDKDVVRSSLVTEIIRAYEAHSRKADRAEKPPSAKPVSQKPQPAPAKNVQAKKPPAKKPPAKKPAPGAKAKS